MVVILGEHARISVLIKKIIADDDSHRASKGVFSLLGDRTWQIGTPPWFWKSTTNQHLRTAYVIAVATHRVCTAAKVLECLIYGRWLWEGVTEWLFILTILGNWSTYIIALTAGHRDLPLGLVLQLITLGIIIGTHNYPNWWEYRWELSFVFPGGFLCYKVGRRLGIRASL